MKKIFNVDLEKYEVFEVIHKKDSYVAVAKSEKARLKNLLKTHGRYESIPPNEMVDAFTLKYDKKSNRYFIDEWDKKSEIPINHLYGTFININIPKH